MAISVIVSMQLGNCKPIEDRFIQGIDDVATRRKLAVPGGQPGVTVKDLFPKSGT